MPQKRQNFIDMSKLLKIISLMFLCSCALYKNVDISGTYEETHWGPMTQEYIFNNNGTFLQNYSDDTYGTFGKGTYELKKKRLQLKYDSLLIDQPIITKSRRISTDSLNFILILNDCFSKTLKVFNEEELFYKANIQTDTLYFRFKRPIDNLRIQVVEDMVTKEELRFEFSIELSDYSLCEVEYYSSNSWCKYNSEKNSVVRVRKLKEDSFELHKGKYYWVYKRKEK